MRIGKFEVVHQASFIQMSGQDALIEFDLLNEKASFRVKITSDNDLNENSDKRVETGPDPDHDDRGLLTFVNWKRSTATSSGEPMVVATMGEENDLKQLFLVALVSYVKDNYAVQLQFMLEVE